MGASLRGLDQQARGPRVECRFSGAEWEVFWVFMFKHEAFWGVLMTLSDEQCGGRRHEKAEIVGLSGRSCWCVCWVIGEVLMLIYDVSQPMCLCASGTTEIVGNATGESKT